MLFFALELDEQRIKEDHIVNPDAAWQTIEETFAQRDVTFHHSEGNIRYYTRNIDKHDFEYLWMVNMAMEKEVWFRYYIKTWMYIDIDDDTNELYEDEDLLDEPDMVFDRPTKEQLEQARIQHFQEKGNT